MSKDNLRPEAIKMPIHRMKKVELVWMYKHRCKHHHTYLEHYSCYLTEHPNKQRIGFLDIEASNLDADYGIMLSYCIKDGASKKIHEGAIRFEDVQKAKAGCEDKKLCQKLIKDILKYDILVTWYGRKFDVPFIRTRSIICGVDFPSFGSLIHIDAYYFARFRLKLSSNRLENVCRQLLGKTLKTHIQAKYWRGGVRGDKKSLKYILDHNRKDVIDLEKVYYKLLDYARRSDTSI